jgi:hypothetical protein
MHGWISLPLIGYQLLALFAFVFGAALGWTPVRRNNIALWLAYSFVYAVFALLVAFACEFLHTPGDYDLAPWLLLLLPTLLIILPTMGVPWLLAHLFARNRPTAPADYRIKLLMAFTLAVVLGAVALIGWQPSVKRQWMRFFTAPLDLTSITNGSDWTCVAAGQDGPMMVGVLDLHFSAGEAKRWQSFQHAGSERPFFDLEHAVDKDVFAAGTYSTGLGKILLEYKAWGKVQEAGAGTVDATASAPDASRVRGAIVLQETSEPLIETLSIYSPLPETMTFLGQYGQASNYGFLVSCGRMHIDGFREVRLLDSDIAPRVEP